MNCFFINYWNYSSWPWFTKHHCPVISFKFMTSILTIVINMYQPFLQTITVLLATIPMTILPNLIFIPWGVHMHHSIELHHLEHYIYTVYLLILVPNNHQQAASLMGERIPPALPISAVHLCLEFSNALFHLSEVCTFWPSRSCWLSCWLLEKSNRICWEKYSKWSIQDDQLVISTSIGKVWLNWLIIPGIWKRSTRESTKQIWGAPNDQQEASATHSNNQQQYRQTRRDQGVSHLLQHSFTSSPDHPLWQVWNWVLKCGTWVAKATG